MEPISTALLAALILAARGGADEAGKETARSTWRGVPKLVKLVRTRFGSDDKAIRALAAAQQHPQDQHAVGELANVISHYEKSDHVFNGQLETLIADARRFPVYSDNSGFFANYGWIGKYTTFNAPVTLEQGDFNIS